MFLTYPFQGIHFTSPHARCGFFWHHFGATLGLEFISPMNTGFFFTMALWGSQVRILSAPPVKSLCFKEFCRIPKDEHVATVVPICRF